jgi:hypothetical protein
MFHVGIHKTFFVMLMVVPAIIVTVILYLSKYQLSVAK